jgi:protein TonB
MKTLAFHIGDLEREAKQNKASIGIRHSLQTKEQPEPIIDTTGDNSEMTIAIYDQMLIAKRLRHAKDDSNRALFLAFGLAVSLALIIMAMEWKFYENSGLSLLNASELNTFEEVLDIPNTIQPPPPPPEKNMAPVFTEVDDEVILEELDLNIDVEMSDATIVKAVIYEPVKFEMEEEKAEEIFTIVEQMAVPVGGMSVFYKYVAETIEYPAFAKRGNIQGKVYLRFVIGKTGKISNVEVLKGIGGGCDEEAVRVIENAPNWIPGRQRGKAVKVYMSVPIIFTLRE